MKRGVLLVNLGSPDSPSVSDVRRYLREFLMDERVMDLPYLGRFALVHGVILPFRPKQSAAAYKTVWLKEGSPLVVMSRRLQEHLRKRMDMPVELAMRYQNPSIQDGVRRLVDAGVTELLLVPLFPHYAMSSFETAVERVKEVWSKLAPGRTWRVLAPFFEEPGYIDALVASAEPYLKDDYDCLLFSFHGLPERHLRKSDPTGRHCLITENCCDVPSPAHETCYRAQCFRTVGAFVQRAQVPPEKYRVAFQSRLGRDPWLKPYTDLELERFPTQGIKRLIVVCPAFVADCLETLEEIGERGRETFLKAGGESFALIPCLNEHPRWVQALEELIQKAWTKKELLPA